jgi:outer membrane protein assembly factor BamB
MPLPELNNSLPPRVLGRGPDHPRRVGRLVNVPGLLFLALLAAAPRLCAENWPAFRGPTRQGLSTETGLPIKWSATENVRWQTPVPGTAWSSPVAWGDNVFLTTATDEGASCRVLALNALDGKILWNTEVFRQSIGHKNDRNSCATPTPCTDGERVYAVFGDGSFAALDLMGHTAWTNRNFPFYSEHGLGTSLVLWEDLLIMARDGSHPPPDTGPGWHTAWDQAFLVALDKRSGQVRWKASRGMSRIAHVVPNIWSAPDGQAQVISGAGDVVQGFDAKTGDRLWTAKNIGEGVVPSIVLGDGLAFTASGWGGRESIKAFKLGVRGDVGDSSLAWEQRKNLPRVPSFLYLKPFLYTITERGIVMCLKGDTGEIVWQERLTGSFSASPVAAENHIYFTSDEGETTVIEAGPQWKVLASNPLSEKVQASIAVSRKHLFIRTATRLYCIGP